MKIWRSFMKKQLNIINLIKADKKTFMKSQTILFSLLVLLCLQVIFMSSCSVRNPTSSEVSPVVTDNPASPLTPSPKDTENVTITPKPNNPEEGKLIEITKNGITCLVNSATGLVTQVKSDFQTINMEGILIDVGYKNNFMFAQLGYSTLDSRATWELPVLWPKMKPIPAYKVSDILQNNTGFIVELTIDSLTIAYHYEMLESALKVSAVITTTETENQLINGVGFVLKGIEDLDKARTTVEFPGSTPQGKIPCSNYSKYKAVSTDYASPIIQFNQDNTYINLLFVNDQEKWSSGFYSDEKDKPCSVFLTAVEGYLKAGEEMVIGDMYIQLLEENKDPYLAVQDFWTTLGYHVPVDGVQDGPVYSCHPYGTMDTNYFNRLTLQEYAEHLDKIASMGFKNIWLLPIFYHTGDNVYEPIDQGVIDPRYGGEEGAVSFINKAHKLGLRVLFDLVPHGPRPEYPFAKEHDDWISKDKKGNNQIEWECVSFDYNNPEYYNYTVNLLEYYASEFGLDGSRIDCSMGGLSNWQPVDGLRPSSSGLAAGINITKAVREGLIKGGVTPILLPENFHPNPIFAAYTDLFYDMPLYRTMFNLNHANISDTEYVQTLQQWLEAERKTSVKGQIKLRFLGNHDTVTWTFDAQRAQTLYGVDKAKALWSILSFIDGVPFIYQGDEDPATYHLEGENLEQFFRDLFAAREKYLPTEYDINYIYSDTPVFAFTRSNPEGTDTKLVLINVSAGTSEFELGDGSNKVLFAAGAYNEDGNCITLDPYSAVIIQN
jgi:glycosidase